MIEPKFGYISSDINHLTSIPILVVLPLLLVFAVYYGFRKKKKSVKERGQSKWHLLPVRVALCLVVLISAWGMLLYYSMNFAKPKCKEHYQQPDKFLLRSYNHGPYIKSPDIFYDFQAYRTDEFPWCPEDREAVEKMYGVYIEKDDNQKDVKQ